MHLAVGSAWTHYGALRTPPDRLAATLGEEGRDGKGGIGERE